MQKKILPDERTALKMTLDKLHHVIIEKANCTIQIYLSEKCSIPFLHKDCINMRVRKKQSETWLLQRYRSQLNCKEKQDMK